MKVPWLWVGEETHQAWDTAWPGGQAGQEGMGRGVQSVVPGTLGKPLPSWTMSIGVTGVDFQPFTPSPNLRLGRLFLASLYPSRHHYPQGQAVCVWLGPGAQELVEFAQAGAMNSSLWPPTVSLLIVYTESVNWQ